MAKKKYTEEQLTGPAPESALKKAGRGIVGGISAVANIIDIPSSMINDTQAAITTGKWSKYNPLDQLLTPHRSDNRISGRDLNRLQGLAGKKDTWANWTGGLAREIATDPLTYFTFGGSAIGKVSKAMKMAGVHGDTAASIYTKAMGAAPGAYGKRQARLGLTPSMVQKVDPDAFTRLQGVAGRTGFDLTKNMDVADGGLAKFWPTGSIIGTGKTAQKMAGFMDDVGTAIRDWKIPGTDVRPVGDIANMFNQRALGGTNRALTQLGGKILDDKTAARAGVRQQVAHLTHERQRLKITPEQFDEWLDYPQKAPAYAQPMIQEARQLWDGLPQQYKEWGGVLEDVNKQMQFMGSDVKYKPRHILDNLLKDNRSQAARPFSGFTKASMERWDWTKSVNGGDAVLRDMAKHVHFLRQQGIVKTADVAAELESKFGMNFAPEYIPGKQIKSLLSMKKHKNLDLAGALQLAAQGKKVKGKPIKALSTFQSAAEDFGRMSDEALEHGVWGNDPLVDIAHSTVQSHESLEAIKNTITHLAEKYKADKNSFAKKPGSVPLGELIAGNRLKKTKGLGMTAGDQKGGAARKFWQLAAGLDIGTMKKKRAKAGIRAFKQLHVDKETASFLQQLHRDFTAPETIGGMAKLWDSLTSFTKSLFTTADFIRFNARNFPGGQFNNAMAEQYSNEGLKAALDLATKGEIAGAAELPIVKQIWSQRAAPATDVTGHTQPTKMRAAAFRMPNGTIYEGPTHADISIDQVQAGKEQSHRAFFNATSGFVTTDGRFVTREEAENLIGQYPLARNILGKEAQAVAPSTGPARVLQPLDDKTASQILSELAYAHEVTAHAGTGNPTHVQHLGGTLDDIASEIPGQKPFTMGGLRQTLKGRPGEWNPKNWRIRGVLGAQETTMPWIRAGEQVGDFTEHMIRFPAFYTLLKQGMDPQEAARLVGEAAVNYQNRHYTKFEQQVMQRLVLFYKFFRGQLPFTLRMLAEQPGGRLAQVLRSVNRSRDEDELTPDWIKETASFPVGEADDGTKRYITGFGLPFEDPIQFASPSGQNMMLEGASRLNPLIKGPLEYMTGQSFFQKGGPHGGRPLDELDPPLGRTLANIRELVTGNQSKAPVRYPGSGAIEHMLANSPLSPFLTKARTLTDPRKGSGAKASNLLSGLKITDVSPAAQDRELRNRVQRIEKALGARTFTETFLPKDIKESLSPAQAAQAAQVNALKRLLDERAKTRKAKK